MRSFQVSVTLFALLALIPVANAQTSGFVEAQFRTDLAAPRNTTMLDLGVSHKLNQRWGISGFALVMSGWGELYAGPTFKPTSHTSLGLSGGGVQAKDCNLVPRWAASASWSDHGLTLQGLVETDTDWLAGKGDSGMLYNVLATYSPTKYLAVGLRTRRPDGFGPHLGLNLGPVSAWMTWTPWLPEVGTWRSDRVIWGVVAPL